MLNGAYKPPASHSVTEDTLMEAATTPRIVKKAEALFRLMPAEVADFDHFGAARWLLENPSALDADTSILLIHCSLSQSLDLCNCILIAA